MDKNIDCVERWTNTGLLGGFSGKEESAANCLQTQLERNQQSKEDHPQFNKITIPVLVRALSHSEAFNNNDFRRMEGTDHEVYFFKTKYKSTDGLDEQAEADMTADLATSLKNEIDDTFADRQRNTIYFGGIDLLNDNTIVMYYQI